jgi:hypothetical protein
MHFVQNVCRDAFAVILLNHPTSSVVITIFPIVFVFIFVSIAV